MPHISIPELSQAVEEIKNKLIDIEIPSKEYKENLEKAVQDVKNDILSISDVFNSIEQALINTTKQVFDKVNELTQTVEEFKINTILSPTDEFKTKLNGSINELKVKFDLLKTPTDNTFDSFKQELDIIREQIFNINNPSADSKKVITNDLLDSIASDDQLKTKFAKNVLLVSHAEDFVFPPEGIEVIPSITTFKVNWESIQYADIYKVFIAKDGEPNYKQLHDVTNTSIVIPGLIPDTKYNIYIISAKSSGQISTSSKLVSATTLSNQ